MIGAKIIRVKICDKVIPEMLPQSGPKATVNEIHVSGLGITLQLVRAGGYHYSL